MSVPRSEIRIKEIQLKTELRLAGLKFEVLHKFDPEFDHTTLQLQNEMGGKIN